MKKFIIEDDFWELFPNAKIGIITCNGIDNTIKDENQYKDMISQGEKEALNHLPNEEFSSNEVIKVWRDAFKKFKTKKGARSSIEALLKRVSTGKGLGTINPLVDIYNSISLKYAMPCGGEDMDKFIGDIRLSKATGDESFITLGSDKSEPPYEGEIVYKDDEGAICRCWNWRESVRTMLTEDTKDAILVIEAINEEQAKRAQTAMQELKDLAKDYFGVEGTIYQLSAEHASIEV